ncbi:RpiR family transcriptional regulator [Streptomyces daqingensis]|uniref:RpiR family transcriptional regulator n=1 Tax=Streptomyces daqingensis TaxID=1472640 RepID=A0ABQ2LUG0_9ACTN|nr:DoxX family membrane protein [Streptomyces daqingensis]GGO43366.1 RpiR family transcriptional regulator [Streptomyces daqingensis]
MGRTTCRTKRHRHSHVHSHSHRHGSGHSHGHRTDLGLLALRLGTGGVLVSHGTQKLFGWFGGGGLEATGQSMAQIGFKPGGRHALASGLGEAGGGALLALGLASPGAGAAVAAAMAGAASVHAPAGFFNEQGGLEFPAYLALAGAALAVAGPGRYSLDHLLGHRLNRPWMLAATFSVAAAAASAVISRRLRAQAGEAGPEEAGGSEGVVGSAA